MSPEQAEPQKVEPLRVAEYEKMRAEWLETHTATDPVLAGAKFAEKWNPIQRLMATIEYLDTEGKCSAKTYLQAEIELKDHLAFKNSILASLALARDGRIHVSGKLRKQAVDHGLMVEIAREVPKDNGKDTWADLIVEVSRPVLGPTGKPLGIVR